MLLLYVWDSSGFRERAGDFLLIKQVQKRLSAFDFHCQRNSRFLRYLKLFLRIWRIKSQPKVWNALTLFCLEKIEDWSLTKFSWPMTNQIFYYLEIPVVINFNCQRHSRRNLNEKYKTDKTKKIVVVFVTNELPKTESLLP